MGLQKDPFPFLSASGGLEKPSPTFPVLVKVLMPRSPSISRHPCQTLRNTSKARGQWGERSGIGSLALAKISALLPDPPALAFYLGEVSLHNPCSTESPTESRGLGLSHISHTTFGEIGWLQTLGAARLLPSLCAACSSDSPRAETPTQARSPLPRSLARSEARLRVALTPALPTPLRSVPHQTCCPKSSLGPLTSCPLS